MIFSFDHVTTWSRETSRGYRTQVSLIVIAGDLNLSETDLECTSSFANIELVFLGSFSNLDLSQFMKVST